MKKLLYYYPQGHQAHYEYGHPESPERVEIIRRALETAGWWEPYPRLEPWPVPLEFLGTIHTLAYLQRLAAACERGFSLDMDTYTTPASFALALQTAGGAAAIAEAVWSSTKDSGGASRGFAICRPPGHHAERRSGMGFCLINNIAVAAERLLSMPLDDAANPSRLAIIDIDLHHGNGTQDIFWERDDVLFISTHQSPLYPGSGALEDIGAGKGQGYTVNLPFPPATGTQGFQAAMERIILPLLNRCQPEMLLVSVGFDPHWRDPLGHLQLTAAGMGGLISQLTTWADENCHGRIMVVTEGGYDPQAIAACSQACVAALLDAPFEDPLGPPARPDGNSWRSMIDKAAKYLEGDHLWLTS